MLMTTITALVRQKRNAQRVNVFLDGEYAFSLEDVTAATLSVGQELGEEQIAGLLDTALFEQAKARALNYLTYRPRSTAELRRYLLQKGYDEDVADRVLGRLGELGLVDDDSFARYWVEQRQAFRPRSQLALRQELFQKGIDRVVVDEVVAELDDEEAARQAAARRATRLAGLPEEEFLRRLAGYLQRRGFGYSVVERVCRELWSAQRADDGPTTDNPS
jgi:regulatory protein